VVVGSGNTFFSALRIATVREHHFGHWNDVLIHEFFELLECPLISVFVFPCDVRIGDWKASVAGIDFNKIQLSHVVAVCIVAAVKDNDLRICSKILDGCIVYEENV
jgi:hypothetical protein